MEMEIEIREIDEEYAYAFPVPFSFPKKSLTSTDGLLRLKKQTVDGMTSIMGSRSHRTWDWAEKLR
jgi:hypothetical protein